MRLKKRWKIDLENQIFQQNSFRVNFNKILAIAKGINQISSYEMNITL